jgi:hypothetical protein
MSMRLFQVLALAIVLVSALPSAAMADPDGTSAYHIMPTASLLASRPSPLAQSQNTAQTMLYYGGPVLPKIKVVSVIWGKDVNRTTVNNIGPFLAGLVRSSFVDQLKQYSTNLTGVNGHAGTHQTIGRGTYKGQFTITPIHTSTKVTDKAVQAELTSQIAAHHLPAADQNTLYMVYFPSYVTITAGSDMSCVSFSAYHSASPATVGGNIFYGVMPDCSSGFASLTIASSHELAEALTDGIPTPGTHPAYPQAWNTSNGFEIADLCEGTRSTLTIGAKRYAVQQLFLNTTKACGKGAFHSP